MRLKHLGNELMKLISTQKFIVWLLLVASHTAMADVVVKRNSQNLTAVVSIENRINHKDWQALKDALDEVEADGYELKLNAIVLNSKGGGPTSARALGKIIRDKKLNTYVSPKSECSSACVDVLISGVVRMAFGTVKVHRTKFYEVVPIDELEDKLIGADKITRDYIEHMGISSLLTEATLMTPEYATRTLTMREKENWGVHAIERIHEAMWIRKTAIRYAISIEDVTDVLVDNYYTCERKAKIFEMTLLECTNRILASKHHKSMKD